MVAMADSFRHSVTCYGTKEKSPEQLRRVIVRGVALNLREPRQGTGTWPMKSASRDALQTRAGKRLG